MTGRGLLTTLGVPFGLALVPTAGLALTGADLAGWPASVIWLFACIPLTSAWLAWISRSIR